MIVAAEILRQIFLHNLLLLQCLMHGLDYQLVGQSLCQAVYGVQGCLLYTSDLFGIRQSGDMEFALADIYQDAQVLKEASEAGGAILKLDPDLSLEQHRRLRERLLDYAKERLELPGL